MSDDENLPPDVLAAFEQANLCLLPEKSRSIYERAYEDFRSWQKERNISSFSEKVFLAYFNILSKKYQPNSLYSKASMLRKMVLYNHKIDIDKYSSIQAFLKQNIAGYERKKSKVFSAENIQKFVTDASDNLFLVTKVAAIFGVCGALRTCEMLNVTMKDIEDKGNYIRVNIPDTKNKMPKYFTIDGVFYNIVKSYLKLRPAKCKTDRFFINFQKEKCTNQPIGKNKLGHFPRDIATFLKLPDPETYTGHCFRRTSATILADSGANMETLKRHGGWKSTAVAEGYIQESEAYKRKTGKIIETAIASSSTDETMSTNSNETPASTSKLPFTISVSNCSNWHISMKD